MSIRKAATLPPHIASANRFLVFVLWGLFLFSLCLAPWYGTWMPALVAGILTALIPTLLVAANPAAPFTRWAIAAALMAFCGLNIHQGHGRLELHFGIFALLAMLLCYEDWKVIVVGALVIAVHHAWFSYLQNAGYSVFCMPDPGFAMVAVHAVYVVLEATALCYLSIVLARKTANTQANRAELQQHLDAMNALAGDAQQSVEQINSASEELAGSSQAIAAGAKKQAESLTQAAASLGEIREAVVNSTGNAKQADRLAVASGESARQGGDVVSEAVTAMREINVASAKISEITSTINEIAFQTNLLAVNAAVEAARAGEAGRGFAVVAAEVRSLAQRTTGASKEIKGLIEDTLQKVDRGASLVNRSGQTLEGIVDSVDRVTKMVGDIAMAAEEQSTGVNELNAALAKMGNVTEINTTETEQMATMARSLSVQAAHLMKLIGALTSEKRSDSAGAIPGGHSFRIEKHKLSARSAKKPASRTEREVVAADSTAGHAIGTLITAGGGSEDHFDEF
jgi:methyl-accepting chemotaxis protein